MKKGKNMTDKAKVFKAGSRSVGFKKAAQAVDLQKAFQPYGIDFTHGENDM